MGEQLDDPNREAVGLEPIWTGADEAAGPTISAATPSEMTVDVASGLSLAGGGFVDGSVIEFDGVAQDTQFGTDSSISTVSPFTPSAAGTIIITVRNPDDAESNDWPLTVIAATSGARGTATARPKRAAAPEPEPASEPSEDDVTGEI